MTEIYGDISNTVKQLAETVWNISMRQQTPAEAANFLHNVTEYYRHILTEEEIEFLQFYFQTKMEMIKNE